jgi:hypothetical protein
MAARRFGKDRPGKWVAVDPGNSELEKLQCVLAMTNLETRSRLQLLEAK